MARLSDALRPGGREQAAYEAVLRMCSMCGGTGGRPVTSGGVGEGKCQGCWGEGHTHWRMPPQEIDPRAKPALRSTQKRDKPRPKPTPESDRLVNVRPPGITLDTYEALKELGWIKLIKHTDALHMLETPDLFDNGAVPDLADADHSLPRGGKHR